MDKLLELNLSNNADSNKDKTFETLEPAEKETFLSDNCFNLMTKIDELMDRSKAVFKLHSRITMFEENLEYCTIKSILKSLISYLEDIKKSLRSLANNQNKRDRASDLKLDIVMLKQLLKTNGLRAHGDDSWIYKGESFQLGLYEWEKSERLLIDEMPVLCSNELEDKIDYLIKLDKLIYGIMMAENEKLFNLLTEKHKKTLLNNILNFFQEQLKQQSKITELAEEDYCVKLEELALGIEGLLENAGVSFHYAEGEYYNEDLQTILKIVDTDNEELDGKIAFCYAPTYKFGESIIATERVDVYVLKK